MELSSIIGKEILAPSGDKLGYTKNVFLSKDRKKLSSLLCIDEDEEEFVLPARAILASDDVIIAGKARLNAPTGLPCPIGIPAYSDKGELMGVVGDLLLGGGDPVYVIVKNGVRTSFSADCVVPGKTIIIYPEGKPERIAREKKSAAKQAASPKKQTSAPAAAEQPEPDFVLEQTENVAPANSEQTENALNRCNLLGRRVKKSVYGENREPIALQGERITPEIISRARRHNRLLQLTVNTLTNIY